MLGTVGHLHAGPGANGPGRSRCYDSDPARDRITKSQPSRFSAATLVQAGGLNLLFDAGRGCAIRLRQIGVPLGSVAPVFLTHFHSDHTVGLPDLWMTGYIQTSYAMRRAPMVLIGPVGTKHMAENMRAAFIDDIRIRMADEKTPEIATQIDARDFNSDDVVFEANGVKVTAFAVNHGPLIHPAYGYRVDHAGHSVLISGDTKFDEAVIRHGTGADLLVHEVCDAPSDVLDKLQNRAIMEHHTSPEEAGTVFSRAKPKLAAYTHIIQLTARGSTTTPDVAQIEAATRRTYSGPLAVGEDLMRFVISNGTVALKRWDAVRQTYSE
ncbi:MBL fold metallo-hydrolase [Methylobacterium nodulans]|uniref:Beta-lactamase domain protein n=1 Tax=Methylobacterium nodulans (strain LMG 21967 / CNCM I-2342 / ORS 2060) TaxID=460265 RepID=B8IKX4_METNO|nr:MBL fold metallo-hydrolase [Methylobacterium nodulans]ACL58162.1 beta-lactamase domain protein [Methylobacterium nodulans ORS 2060]